MTSSSAASFIPRHTLVGLCAGIGAAIIWGLWPVITRHGVTNDFSAESVVASRFLFCGLLLLPYYLKGQLYKKISIFRSLLLSSSAGAIYVYVSALGLNYVPAGHLGIVETGTMLALSALGGYLFLGETKTTTQIIGYALVIGGLTAVSWHSFFEHSENQFLGDGLLIIGGILWAIYTVLAKKWNINSWDAVASISVTSLFLWGPIILIFGNLDFSAQTASTWLFQGVTQGIVTSIVGLWLYSFAVQTLGASRGSLLGALVPAIAILGGYLFLSEVPNLTEICGLFLTSFGILLSLNIRNAS